MGSPVIPDAEPQSSPGSNNPEHAELFSQPPATDEVEDCNKEEQRSNHGYEMHRNYRVFLALELLSQVRARLSMSL